MTEEKFKKDVFVLKDKLFRYAYSLLNNSDDAQDVTQDVLMKLWNMRKRLSTYSSIEAFAMTIIRNVSIDRLRRVKTRYEKEPEIIIAIETKVEENVLENKELEQQIMKAINALDEPQRSILHLRDVEGYEFKEIGDVLEMPIESIRVYLSRARKKVREELQKVLNYEYSGY